MAMNLIDIAEELEFVPKADLAAMIDNPNSRYPSFMVLSEIQRRTKMEKMFETARMQTPQTTVAEEAVMEMTGIGAMPMQAGMSSPVNSQGSGLQGMAPPVQMQAGGFTDLNLLTAFMRQNLVGGSTPNQTYSPTRMNNMFDKLLLQAQANDPAAIANIQTLLNLPEFQTFKQQQQAQPPSVLAQSFGDTTTPVEYPEISSASSQSLMTLPKDLTEGFPYQRPEFKSVDLSLTEPKDLTEGFDYKRPPFKGLPQLRLATEEERDKFRGFTREELRENTPQTLRDVTAFGLEEVRAVKERKAQEKGLADLINRMQEDMTTLDTQSAGLGGGQARTSKDDADDTSQGGLASANNPDLTRMVKEYQKRIDEIITPADEFVSQLGDPVTLRTREQITEDVSSRLNLPEVTALKPTEEERQRDMNVALLTGLGAIIGGARRPGDIATGIGKLGSDIAKMRRDTRKEDRLADRLTRQETIQNINLISGIVNAEQAAERATKQLQIQERKDFDASQLAKTQLEISRAKLEEGGFRLGLAEQANRLGLAKFDLDEIKALQQQVQNLQASLVADPLINANPTKAARIQGQIDALNQEIMRKFNVPELQKKFAEVQKLIDEKTKEKV
tara:strand:- start:112 stop:1962 length:1851 start_codon:yes stop_codon:yes gene_type:complete